jgi:hypothetical protein
MKSLALMMSSTPSQRSSFFRWFMSTLMRQAHILPPEALMSSRNSGTSGTSRPAMVFFIIFVAIVVIPGSGVSA